MNWMPISSIHMVSQTGWELWRRSHSEDVSSVFSVLLWVNISTSFPPAHRRVLTRNFNKWVMGWWLKLSRALLPPAGVVLLQVLTHLRLLSPPKYIGGECSFVCGSHKNTSPNTDAWFMHILKYHVLQSWWKQQNFTKLPKFLQRFLRSLEVFFLIL